MTVTLVSTTVLAWISSIDTSVVVDPDSGDRIVRRTSTSVRPRRVLITVIVLMARTVIFASVIRSILVSMGTYSPEKLL